MAKGISNNAYLYGPTGLGNTLLVDHIKKCLDVEGYQNGSDKVLKMDMCKASYLRGVYYALGVLTDIYISLKKHGSGTALITNLLDDEFFSDYIVDHFAFKQKLSPTTYSQIYEQAKKEGNLIEV